MKSVTAVCASSLNGVATGRVHRQRRDVENEEIQMYLSKLKELVPFIPKNRRLSKLEVIQHVIDYIGDLQYALETHPAVVGSVNSAVTATTLASRSTTSNGAASAGNLSPRQPLGTIAPNAILPTNTPCATQEQITTPPHLDKVIPSDSRPVSC